MAKVLTEYAVRFTGLDSVTAGFASVGQAQAKAGENTAGWNTRLSGALDNVSGKFKGVSRDVDAIAGKSAAEFSKMTSDVMGMAAAFAGGGLTGAIALAVTVYGKLLEAQQREAAALEKAKKDAEELGRLRLASVNAEITAIQERTRGISEEESLRRNLLVARLSAENRGVSAMLAVSEAAAAKQREIANKLNEDLAGIDDRKGYNRAGAQAAEANAAATALEKAAATQRAIITANNEEITRLEKTMLAAQGADRENARKEENKRSDEAKKTEEQRLLELLEKTKQMYAARSAEKKRIADADKRLADQEKETDREIAAGKLAIADAEQKAFADSLKVVEEDTKKREENLLKIREQNVAMATQSEQLSQAAAINFAYANSQMVVSAAFEVLNPQLQQFGQLNRDNYRDLLIITDNTVAAFAAQVQAALWGMAQQATQKSVFESAEAGRETALAVGSLAMYDAAGAMMHGQSAALHNVAAIGYAGIAGGSAAASLGVGMSRGSGGIFALTKEEKERMSGGKNGGGGGREPTLSSSGGGIGGTGRDSGPVVINYVYEAGAIDARNGAALASTVARGTRLGRDDWFAQRAGR